MTLEEYRCWIWPVSDLCTPRLPVQWSTHASLGHLPSASSSQVNHSPGQHCLSFQLHCKSYGPLRPGTVKCLAMDFINGVQKRGRDNDTSAADCTVTGIHVHSAFALHLPQLRLCLIHGIQAGPANPAGLEGMQGSWQSWHEQDPGCVCPAVGRHSAAWWLSKVTECLTMMSCCVFQLGQSPLIFVLWRRLLDWQSGIWVLRLEPDLDTQEILLCLRLCGYIRSAWAAVGSSSPWSLDCCWHTPWRGLFHNLGHSQGHIAALGQIPLAAGIACSLWGSWLGSLTTESFGSGTPKFLQDVWPDQGRSRGFPSRLCLETQRELCVVPSSPRTLGEALVAVLPVPQGLPVLGGVEGWMLTGLTPRGGWAGYSFPWETTRVGAYPQPSTTDCGCRECSKEDYFLEQIELQIWANVSFQ